MQSKIFRGATASLFMAALAACGGGGGSTTSATPTSTTLTVTGTAATGLAIPGATVTGKCKVGTGTATTLTDGGYTLTISDGQLPCVLQITNPADGIKLHTVVFGTGSTANANITPLTEMATARVLGSEPNVFFAAFDAAVATQKITTTAVQAAQIDIGLVLTGTVDTTALGNFISIPLKAATQGSPNSGDVQDKLLDALKLKLSSTQIGTLATTLASNRATAAIKQTVASITGGGASTPLVPVANAGVEQSVITGTTVTLHASNSSAAAGKSLTYAWTLNSKPVGSTATLAPPSAAKPTFVADVAGSYVASVIINDGTTASSAAAVTVTASVANAAPVANAGVTQNVVASSAVTLDGSASSDANSDPLTYSWSLTSKPAGSTAALSTPTSAKPTFTADVAGTFIASLTVNDGKVNSAPVTASVKSASSWAMSGVLLYERYQHTASVLKDGSILVAGGMNSYSLGLITAERYDPVKGIWAEVGRMNQDRSQHTATVLQSGRVLVVGGAQGNTAPMADVEIFEPATNTWAKSISLNSARRNHTATLLADGSVLVAGSSVNDTKSTEVFDSFSENWTIKGDMLTFRSSHTATLLMDGRVLVVGGMNGSSRTATAELYDPRTGSWTATGSMAAARTAHNATLLPNGKVLVAGGETTIPSSAELYDPTTGTWSAAAPMNTARSAHASVALSSGLVLITGGVIPGDPKLGIPNQIADSAEMYDFRTDSWTSAGKLSVNRFYHTASLLQSGKVLIAGSYGSTVITELFTPF